MTWLAFLILNPSIFPTSVLRQALFQGFVYGMFVLAWWLIYRAAPQRRLFAMVAFVAGGVFFPGYVHLFHIYGIMYVPVMLTLGALLCFYASNTFEQTRIVVCCGRGTSRPLAPVCNRSLRRLLLWFYLETFWQRSRAQHVQAVVILLAGMMAIVLWLSFSRGQTR